MAEHDVITVHGSSDDDDDDDENEDAFATFSESKMVAKSPSRKTGKQSLRTVRGSKSIVSHLGNYLHIGIVGSGVATALNVPDLEARSGCGQAASFPEGWEGTIFSGRIQIALEAFGALHGSKPRGD
jgi:hypothetical protein